MKNNMGAPHGVLTEKLLLLCRAKLILPRQTESTPYLSPPVFSLILLISSLGAIDKDPTVLNRKLKLSWEPSVLQIRFRGCKGVVVLDRTLPGHQLLLRNSMKKFDSSPECSTMEHIGVVGWSGARPPAKLNNQVCILYS